MSALFKSRLFAPAIFATALFGAGEQVPVTPQVPLAGGGISREIQTYNLAKHVKLSGNTWQEQDTYGYAGIKYDLIAQYKVFALGKTEQEQVSAGSITSTNLVNVYKTDRLVSTHYRLNVATAQNQEVSRGTISTRNISNPILADNSNAAIGNGNTAQNQHTVGKIISKQPIAKVDLVSTHYHANAITAQSQCASGKVTVTQNLETPIAVSVKAATYQRQAISGRITANDEDEMLMVLMALLELDDEVT